VGLWKIGVTLGCIAASGPVRGGAEY